jgi:hypothetical protein
MVCAFLPGTILALANAARGIQASEVKGEACPPWRCFVLTPMQTHRSPWARPDTHCIADSAEQCSTTADAFSIPSPPHLSALMSSHLNADASDAKYVFIALRKSPVRESPAALLTAP